MGNNLPPNSNRHVFKIFPSSRDHNLRSVALNKDSKSSLDSRNNPDLSNSSEDSLEYKILNYPHSQNSTPYFITSVSRKPSSRNDSLETLKILIPHSFFNSDFPVSPNNQPHSNSPSSTTFKLGSSKK